LSRKSLLSSSSLKGADINFKDRDGSTPLHYAVYHCASGRVVQALIDSGADVNTKTNHGGTPLDEAKTYGCGEIKEILMKAGAK